MSQPLVFEYNSRVVGKERSVLIDPIDGGVYVRKQDIHYFAECDEQAAINAIEIMKLEPVIVTRVNLDGYSDIAVFNENSMARIISLVNPVLFINLVMLGVISES